MVVHKKYITFCEHVKVEIFVEILYKSTGTKIVPVDLCNFYDAGNFRPIMAE